MVLIVPSTLPKRNPETGETNLADVSSSQSHQRGEPVGDVEQCFGDPSPPPQQGAVHECHPTYSPLPIGPLGIDVYMKL